ncbi:chromosome segregation protein, putative [Plasmodium berghei]|uniref:Structural maintenance of chromosomes protein n=2 Tax=Plasmodium berghei TaxID=5821 RepID=A0A509AU41_PLABA|nr:structural maintenance of chromosomes protein 2, putative [Plasmodium berghei ANKA]CXJ14883.1 chromosome segregation protein, putative [Plasmodium berghei]SCM26219.1 chromosome segregation protein, putative [Plasmodium berghei]SCN28339.1 chromosome segregation protein, putative [Plasmodium berghei]SCO62537.1 chromosome segregation protein, putative [Plasmodium berghei]SCO64095.1 chromosome segregation protein, putative [Plasmodium berghei]|eukprot:XP_034423991.1 structural maintenance of chromosomes protein 2, putative [Plasmodium berghei ANKA]
MHIEEIILDGFKSYPTKTVIGPFHPQFNAITGLNGSGKSNVLDAICFVMGINNLNLIRVNRLDELIYKQGQAGITKGSVTIKFNNEEKPSPLQEPYRDMKTITITRQIMLGGRNRYLLNSHNAKPKDISDFFQSLKLNINNPHFLIMQGKITKVINMKPVELLGLIEESSGTKLYEVKRTNAIKLMVKKDQKLEEINKVLVEEIEPTLIKLKKEKEEYNKFISNNEEIEKYEKLDISYKYYVAKNIMIKNQEKIEECTNEQNSIESNINSINYEIEKYKSDKDKLVDETAIANEPIKLLIKEKEELEKKISNLKSEIKIETKEKEKERKKREDIKKEIKFIEKKLNDYEKNDEKNNKTLRDYENLRNKIQTLRDELNEKQRTINCLLSGGISNDNAEGNNNGNQYNGSFRDQLKNYKTDLSKTETKINNLLQNSKHLEKEIISLKNQRKKYEKEFNEINKEKIAEEKKKEGAEKQLEKINSQHKNFEDMANLQKDKYNLRNELDKLNQEIQILKNLINNVKIDFKIPNNMKESDVYGQIYKLIKIKKDYENTSLAIHLILGGKLSYILVQNKENSKKLFEYNNFSQSNRRVTLLPLKDCIVGRDLNEKSVEECRKELGLDAKDKKDVIYFLDIMDYDKRFEKLVKYLFNGTIICSNVELCKKITYNSNKKCSYPTITLEGDKFDTSGSMSGGSNKNINLFLQHYEKYQNIKKNYLSKEEEITKINNKLIAFEKGEEEKRKINKDIQIISNNLSNIENRIETSKYGCLSKKIDNAKDEIEKGREELKTLYDDQKRLNEIIRKLEKDITDYENNKDKKEEDLKDSIKKLKNKIKQLETEENKKKEQVDDLLMQIENFKKQVEKERNDLIIADATITDIENKIVDIQKNIDIENENLKELENKIVQLQISFGSYENEIKQVVKKIEDLEKKKTNYALDLKKLDNKLIDIKKDFKSANDTVNYLNKTHVWIESYESLFNKKYTSYDFENFKHDAIQKKIQALQNEQNKLSININRKAVQMYEQVQVDYKDLITKKSQVEEDKKKIQEVIADLDVKKSESLLTMYQQINEYFQAIFSTLLPNSQAKLSIIDGDLANGLEMKIAFNNNWKDSLTELSGGQRSLLALSLILAILKVRTVPMYILDEIDAALDLNHTQNIGDMIRTQFPNSQFIIVSLKEGMFSHADVLFKMRFIDGISTVNRHSLDVRQCANKKEIGDVKKRRVTIHEREPEDD